MLPASNRGAGQSLNFPDVCKTPAPPLPFVPVPYPDIGMNMQAAPFSPFVSIAFMPATNMGTLKVMTAGDEAGSLGGLVTGLIKGPGKTTVGNPLVLVTGLPAESLLNPTSGNMMNAPVGAQVVPSVVNVLYTYRDAPRTGDATDASSTCREPVAIAHEELLALGDVARGEGGAEEAARVVSRWLSPGIVLVRIALFSAQSDRELFNALSRFDPDAIRGVVLDLRGNPGGDARAALRLASDWLPEGTAILIARDLDGDEEPVIALGGASHPWPLAVLVDRGSASAAELVAAALQHHGRATVIGETTYGKASAQRVVPWPDGALRYATVSEYVLPNGEHIDGRGIVPDVEVSVDVPSTGDAPADDTDRFLRAARRVLDAG